MMKSLLVAGFVGIALLAACADDPRAPQSTPVASTATANKGQAIFQANCASCHDPLKDATGPALKGAVARWGGDTARIKRFIRNSAEMINAKDPDAVRVYEKYRPTIMTAFPALTEDEMDALLAYMQ